MEKTGEKNPYKESALAFLTLVVQGKIAEAYAKYVDPHMRHHNVYFAGDAASLQKAMEENHLKFPEKKFEIKNQIAEGNMVAIHSRVRLKPEEPGVGVVHIFRFEGNKIVEMWDLGQPVPKDSPNKNGMF